MLSRSQPRYFPRLAPTGRHRRFQISLPSSSPPLPPGQHRSCLPPRAGEMIFRTSQTLEPAMCICANLTREAFHASPLGCTCWRRHLGCGARQEQTPEKTVRGTFPLCGNSNSRRIYKLLSVAGFKPEYFTSKRHTPIFVLGLEELLKYICI